MNLPPGDWNAGERGLGALAGRRDDFRAALATAIRYAEANGCRQLHAMAGVGPTANEDVFVENLAWAAERLTALGIALLIEPINVIDMPGYFLTLPDQAQRIIERVAHPNLHLQLDLYHCQIMRGDLARQIEAHLPLVRHIQIAGNPGRHEPDVGEINYPYLFDLIDNLGYRGWVGCEYKPLGRDRPPASAGPAPISGRKRVPPLNPPLTTARNQTRTCVEVWVLFHSWWVPFGPPGGIKGDRADADQEAT